MKLFILAVSCLFFVGCSTTLGTYSFASTGNIPIEAKTGNYVEGSDCIHSVFGISFGNKENRITIATAKALENANKKGEPDQALSNVVITQSDWSILFYGQNCINVIGQATGINK